MTNPIIILGAGYTGKYLASALAAASRRFFATSRDPDKNLPHVPVGCRIRFGLEEPSTWPNIPIGADLIWCFPATALKQVRDFSRRLEGAARRIVILGSTSAYEVPDRDNEYPPPWTDELASIDLTKQRVQGEEFLRKDYGAIIAP